MPSLTRPRCSPYPTRGQADRPYPGARRLSRQSLCAKTRSVSGQRPRSIDPCAAGPQPPAPSPGGRGRSDRVSAPPGQRPSRNPQVLGDDLDSKGRIADGAKRRSREVVLSGQSVGHGFPPLLPVLPAPRPAWTGHCTKTPQPLATQSGCDRVSTDPCAARPQPPTPAPAGPDRSDPAPAPRSPRS